MKCIEDEIPFEVPEGWEWCRFRNIAYLKSGVTYPANEEKENGKKMYIKVSDMNLPNNSFEITSSSRYLDKYNKQNLIPKGSVIFPKRGGAILTNKKRLVLKDSILVDLNTMSFTPFISECLLFCYYWFSSFDLGMLNNGSSVPQINNIDIEPLLFPVPPIKEQMRIAHKMQELAPIISGIEAEKNILKNSICSLKSKILDLAIRGKLVPQNPDDEPASVLLDRIRAEKDELIKQGKLKRDKKESIIFRGEDNSYYEQIGNEISCIDKEIPFTIPLNWEYVRLSNVWELISGRDLSPHDYNSENEGIPYITGASNFTDDGDISIVRWTTKPQVITYKGDLLITCKGTVGEIAFNTFGDAHIARQIMAIRNIYNMNFEFLTICLRYYIAQIKASARGIIPGISREDILNLLIPIPPKMQQDEIVLKTKLFEYQLEQIVERI